MLKMPEADLQTIEKRTTIAAALRRIVAGEGVVETATEMSVYESDGLTAYRQLPLVVVLRPGTVLDDAMKARLNNAIKTALSPRFVPNDIFLVAEIPRTLSGKKQELPIKKLLLGAPIDKVVNKEAMANPACLDWYVVFAKQRMQASI